MLAARDLTIGYGAHKVGQGLAVALAEGRVLALLGPNGGGKTTLLKTLLGLIAPLGGEISLADRPLSAISIRDRARWIAYVPQVHSGVFAFSVEDVVLMGRSAHRSLFAPPGAQDRQIAGDALARMGISHLATRPYTQISGGERQLALIARALAQEPRIVVLDEPTASLDFGNQGQVMREIRALAQSGLAIVFSTHDPNHALRYADDALLIRDGRALASGPVQDVLTKPVLERLYGSSVLEIVAPQQRIYLPD